jgi:diguanylate cyclase (GGDEF)-like protein
VQILVALSPKLLNARNSFEIDNLQLQIADMFEMVNAVLAQINWSGRLSSHGATIARQRDALHVAIDQLVTLVRRQMRLRDDMARARHGVDALLGAGDAAPPFADPAQALALAAILYQASLATDVSGIERGLDKIHDLLKRPASQGLPPPPQLASLIEGDASLFSIRRMQIALEQKLQGGAGNTNLRANQLVYAVTNLSAELRRLANQAREEGRQSVHRATLRTSFVLLLAAIIAATLVAYLHISVLRRLVALRNGVVSSAAGSAVPVADDGADEIGDLARSLRHFIEQIGIKEEELRRLAATDVLTGLANRREFMSRGAEEILRARRYNFHVCVLMLDIDHFKKVNDTWGHAVGDKVIRQVASIIREICRVVDNVGRIGGEEFAVLLSQTDIEGALIVAERLRETVAGCAIPLADGQTMGVSISIGLAAMTQADGDLSHLLGRADAALYEAKKLGRNRVRLAISPDRMKEALLF